MKTRGSLNPRCSRTRPALSRPSCRSEHGTYKTVNGTYKTVNARIRQSMARIRQSTLLEDAPDAVTAFLQVRTYKTVNIRQSMPDSAHIRQSRPDSGAGGLLRRSGQSIFIQKSHLERMAPPHHSPPRHSPHHHAGALPERCENGCQGYLSRRRGSEAGPASCQAGEGAAQERCGAAGPRAGL